MTKIHIPDEVVEAGAKQIEGWAWADDASDCYGWTLVEARKNRARSQARAAITVALEAWPKTGMAMEAKGFLYRMPDDAAPQWEAYTNPNYEMTDDPSFPVIMIRTEAP